MSGSIQDETERRAEEISDVATHDLARVSFRQ